MGNKIVNKEERWHLNADNITKLLSQQGMKQKDLSTLNGYWNDRSSAYINELLHHRTVPTDAVEGLQSFFNSLLNCRCRFQYFVIENGDNYLTDEERNKAITNNKISEYNKTIEYLKTIGVNIELNAYLICSPSFIVAYYDEWKDRIDKSNNLEDKISHMSADNTHMSCCIKLSSNLSWWDYRWLHIDDSSPHYETITQYDMDIIRSAITKESAQSFDYEFLYDDYEIHIMYEVSIGEDGKMNDKEVVNIVPVAKMNDFLLSLDKLCKTAASSFLSSSVFSNDIFKWS